VFRPTPSSHEPTVTGCASCNAPFARSRGVSNSVPYFVEIRHTPSRALEAGSRTRDVCDAGVTDPEPDPRRHPGPPLIARGGTTDERARQTKGDRPRRSTPTAHAGPEHRSRRTAGDHATRPVAGRTGAAPRGRRLRSDNPSAGKITTETRPAAISAAWFAAVITPSAR